jgi:DNA-binding HxlR family transcriptional regulator
MKSSMDSRDFKRSVCAVANSLDLIGDKWSLLVVRDLLQGKRTYGELAASPEGIPTNILAERLKRLESAGIITSAAYQQRPVRYAYSLTKKGMALGDVLLALVRWGKEYIPGTQALRQPAPKASQEAASSSPARAKASGRRADP